MRRLLIAVMLVSTAAIAFEILLMRMLSIAQWHHFAWMVISLALLGYGASGTAIALYRDWLEPRFEWAFPACALLFALSMGTCWVLAQRVPFNAQEVVWDPSQFLLLGVLYLLFMVPFLFAALCIGMAFAFRSSQAGTIYLFDLAGGGLGAVLVIGLLFRLDTTQALVVLVLLALLAAIIGARSKAYRLAGAAGVLIVFFAFGADFFEVRVSQFKGLSRALETVGSEVLAERSSPLSSITVVENRVVPFRHAPGLSIASKTLPPEQLALFRDGGGMSAINRWDGHSAPPAHLGDNTSALPYHLLDEPRVLVLGAGTGADVLQALLHEAETIDAVELDPRTVSLVREEFAEFSGGIYHHPRVRLFIGEARGFAARSEQRYDLVQVGLLDAFAVSGSGVQALNENYLYTTESFRDYLELLEPDGVLAITRWLRLPPRDSLKLANIAIATLNDLGVEQPGSQLAMIRGWSTVTLLLKNGPMNASDIKAIEDFATNRAFDIVYHPAMVASQANRFNRLERAWFHEGVTALVGPGAARFTERYKFNIEAATDERPYFFNFFRWPVFFEAISLRDRGGAALVEWGYLVPAATLAQAVLAGFLLVILPLLLARRSYPPTAGGRTGGYFFLLGLAFLFVEIAFIQKFTLFLSHPLYAVAVVLAGFLVFAGFGSGLSAALEKRAPFAGLSAVQVAVCAIVVLALVYALAMPKLFDQWLALGDASRVALALLLIAPLALLMGMPFPIGVRSLVKKSPDFVPWAWGLNGFASVISAALATLLAIELGFTAVLLIALLFYAAAAWLAPDRGAQGV